MKVRTFLALFFTTPSSARSALLIVLGFYLMLGVNSKPFWLKCLDFALVLFILFALGWFIAAGKKAPWFRRYRTAINTVFFLALTLLLILIVINAMTDNNHWMKTGFYLYQTLLLLSVVALAFFGGLSLKTRRMKPRSEP